MIRRLSSQSTPKYAIKTQRLRGMGQRPMERSGTDPEFSAARVLGMLDAAAAVRLPPLPVRALKDGYFFT